jgi:hypothetical protein
VPEAVDVEASSKQFGTQPFINFLEDPHRHVGCPLTQCRGRCRVPGLGGEHAICQGWKACHKAFHHRIIHSGINPLDGLCSPLGVTEQFIPKGCLSSPASSFRRVIRRNTDLPQPNQIPSIPVIMVVVVPSPTSGFLDHAASERPADDNQQDNC